MYNQIQFAPPTVDRRAEAVQSGIIGDIHWRQRAPTWSLCDDIIKVLKSANRARQSNHMRTTCRKLDRYRKPQAS